MKKTVIVTGASGNLGQAVVNKFLKEGFIVVGTVIANDPVPLEIQDKNFEKVVVDLSNEEEAEKFIQQTISKHEIIDAAVLTVGGFAMGKISETKMVDITKQYKLNFETAYNTARPVFIQMMKQGSGRIFMIGSKPGLDPRNAKGTVAYSLAKSLIFRLAELMNDEAKARLKDSVGQGKNVVTSVVVPSTIDTPQNRKSMPDADFNKWVKAEAIADVIYFYCSDKGSIIREPIIKVYNNA